MKSYSTYRHHDPSRFADFQGQKRLTSSIVHCDEKFSQMHLALIGAERPARQSKPVTIRKFSWETKA